MEGIKGIHSYLQIRLLQKRKFEMENGEVNSRYMEDSL